MRFIRVADAEKIAHMQAATADRRQPGEIAEHLSRVTRVVLEGPMDEQFAPLWKAVKLSAGFKRNYAESYFKYFDALGRVHIIKGEEAGEELFRDITCKHTQLLVLTRMMSALLVEFQKKYAATRKLESDGAVRVKLGFLAPQFQLYIESLLHTMKATLELYAVFTPFMFPSTTQGIPEAMDDQIKFFSKESGRQIDPEYAKYLSAKMGWFLELKNLRDVVAHFGSVLLQAEEGGGKINLSLYPRRSHILENRVPYSQVEGWIFNFAEFCLFYRTHFMSQLAKAT